MMKSLGIPSGQISWQRQRADFHDSPRNAGRWLRKRPGANSKGQGAVQEVFEHLPSLIQHVLEVPPHNDTILAAPFAAIHGTVGYKQQGLFVLGISGQGGDAEAGGKFEVEAFFHQKFFVLEGLAHLAH